MRVLIWIVKTVLGISCVVAYALGFTFLLNSMAIVAHLADGFWIGESILGTDKAIPGIFAGIACGLLAWVVWHVDRLITPIMIEHQAR